MREKRCLCAIVLIMALLLDTPQLSQADTMQASLSSPFYEQTYEGEGEKESYDIVYYLNGGIEAGIMQKDYVMEELPIVLDIPQKPGYNFAGWYKESSYRNKISEITADDIGDISLYAKWTRCIDSNYNIQMYSYGTGSMVSGNGRELKNCAYGLVDNVTIPGMPSTREQDYMENMIATEGQCPQGICITNEFYLITAYCSDDSESLGSLYVFDRTNGEYLVTLGMKKNSHLGGLCFDGRNLWICHSDTRSLERLSYKHIRDIALSRPKMFVDVTGMFKEYRVANMPSCITYHDGILWVATHNSYFKSVMISYKYLDDELVEQERYEIPDKVQGIAFDEQDYVYLSTSFGRDKSSYLRVFKNVDALNDNSRKSLVKVEMPPCSEEIYYADGSIYILFESASSKYFEGTDGKGNSLSPIDKIVTLSTSSLR